MNASQTETRYYIFKCRDHECNETIPVISFISQYAFLAGSIYLKRQAVERDYDLITVDVICPFCCAANHFQIKENKILTRRASEGPRAMFPRLRVLVLRYFGS